MEGRRRPKTLSVEKGAKSPRASLGRRLSMAISPRHAVAQAGREHVGHSAEAMAVKLIAKADNDEVVAARYERFKAQLTSTQVDVISAAFRKIDCDGSGGIECAELVALIKRLGYEPSAEELQDLIDEFDYNQTGVLSEDEFMLMVARMVFLQWPPLPEGNSPEEIAQAKREELRGAHRFYARGFRYFDHNHSERIDLDRILQHMGHSDISDSETRDLRAMLAEAKELGFVGKSGKLNYSNFVQHMIEKTGLIEKPAVLASAAAYSAAEAHVRVVDSGTAALRYDS